MKIVVYTFRYVGKCCGRTVFLAVVLGAIFGYVLYPSVKFPTSYHGFMVSNRTQYQTSNVVAEIHDESTAYRDIHVYESLDTEATHVTNGHSVPTDQASHLTNEHSAPMGQTSHLIDRHSVSMDQTSHLTSEHSILVDQTSHLTKGHSVPMDQPGHLTKGHSGPTDQNGQTHSEQISETTRPNVLFLMADDLIADLQLGTVSQSRGTSRKQAVYAPNLRRLASESLLLENSHNQFPLCNPSRASILTGRRPDTTHIYNLTYTFRQLGGNFGTIPQYFRKHGYHSVGMGKIFHTGNKASRNDPDSWSAPFRYSAVDNPYLDYWKRQLGDSWKAISEETRRKHPLPDDILIQEAIKLLRKFSRDETPFFMAVGFYKPHEPMIFPKKYLDHYPEKEIIVPDNMEYPVGMPSIALTPVHTMELKTAHHVRRQRPTGDRRNQESLIRELRQAYFSTVTYIDFLTGVLLKELHKLNLAQNTIVSFVSDHGIKMGEHGGWGKTALFDTDTRVPMLVKIPGVTDSGIVLERPVETVDLFPTLVEAAGLPALHTCPVKSNHVRDCHEGMSLLPLLTNKTATWKRAAFSQVSRGPHVRGHSMGYSIRTVRYRYTEWARFQDTPVFAPDWNTLVGRELYDHYTDPDENVNLARQDEFRSIQQALAQALHNGWRTPLPAHID